MDFIWKMYLTQVNHNTDTIINIDIKFNMIDSFLLSWSL